MRDEAEKAKRSLLNDLWILKEIKKKKKKNHSDVFHARMMKEARAFVRYKMGLLKNSSGLIARCGGRTRKRCVE